MQSTENTKYALLNLTKLLVLPLVVLTIFFSSSQLVSATVLTDEFKECPQTIQDYYTEKEGDSTINSRGTYIVTDDKAGNVTFLKCGNLNGFQKLIAKVFMFIYLIIGVVLMISIGKSAISIMLSGKDGDNVAEEAKSIQTSILAVIGVFASYLIIVFIMTGLLGLGGGAGKYNIVCQNQIMFRLTFDRDPKECV